MKLLHMISRLTVQSRVILTSVVRCKHCTKLQTKFLPILIQSQNGLCFHAQDYILGFYHSKAVRNHYATVSGISGTPPGLWQSIKWKLGFKEKMRYSKTRMVEASRRLYVCISEIIDHNEMITELELPDSFHSWFQVLDLHVWLVMVKLAQLDQEGRFVRNELVRAMWEDVEKRSRVILEGQYYSGRSKFIQSLHGEFQLSLFTYDEGLLSDDRVLACAIWRMLFSMSDVKPEKLAFMVEYIRKQVQFLDKLDSEQILKHGLVCFLPLHGDEENKSRNKQLLNKIRQYEL